MIKAPEEIRVGPLIYRVASDGGDADHPYGELDPAKQLILFKELTQSPTRAFCTLLHEYIHAAEESSSIHSSEQRLTHDQIRWLSHVLTDLLQQLGIDCELDISALPTLAVVSRDE